MAVIKKAAKKKAAVKKVTVPEVKQIVLTQEQWNDLSVLMHQLESIGESLEYVFSYDNRNTMQIALEVGKIRAELNQYYVKLSSIVEDTDPDPYSWDDFSDDEDN
jgi:hypothetical protein